MRPTAASNSFSEDAERWPSAAQASTLLLALEALARWREHVSLTSILPTIRRPDAGYTDAPRAVSSVGRAGDS